MRLAVSPSLWASAVPASISTTRFTKAMLDPPPSSNEKFRAGQLAELPRAQQRRVLDVRRDALAHRAKVVQLERKQLGCVRHVVSIAAPSRPA